MPGMKHMNQDRPVDGQDTLQTMQDKKSGIYQDRTAGKLPQGRVAQHYQDMDAKMEQAKKEFGEGASGGGMSGKPVPTSSFNNAIVSGLNTVGNAYDSVKRFVTGAPTKEEEKATKNAANNAFKKKMSNIVGSKTGS